MTHLSALLCLNYLEFCSLMVFCCEFLGIYKSDCSDGYDGIGYWVGQIIHSSSKRIYYSWPFRPTKYVVTSSSINLELIK